MFTNDMLSKRSLIESVKKVTDNNSIVENKEQLDELSTKTLYNYQRKAMDQITAKGGKGRPSAAAKAAKEALVKKRQAGMDLAAKKIQSQNEKEYQHFKQRQLDVHNYLRYAAPQSLKARGFTKVLDHPKREIWHKVDHDKGIIMHATLPRHTEDSQGSRHEILSMSRTGNTLHSGNAFHSDIGSFEHRHHDLETHSAKALQKMHDHIDTMIKRMSETGMFESVSLDFSEADLDVLTEDLSPEEIENIKKIIGVEE